MPSAVSSRSRRNCPISERSCRVWSSLCPLLMAMVLLFLLDLFRGLPEEEVGADGRADHRDDEREIGWRELYPRHDGRQQQRAPVWLDDDRGDEVRRQRECQQLQDARVVTIGDEDLEQQDADGEDHEDQDEWNPWREHLHARRHRAKVRADVDGVGDEEQPHRE